MEILNTISQVAIFIFGGLAIWFVGRKEDWKKWGYICGLLSQPFFFYATIYNEQWGMTILNVVYLYGWCQGIYNYWIKNEKKTT